MRLAPELARAKTCARLLSLLFSLCVAPLAVQAQEPAPTVSLPPPESSPAPTLTPEPAPEPAPTPAPPPAPPPPAPVYVPPPPPPPPVYIPPPPEEKPNPRDVVFAYNKGLRISLIPGIFIPIHGGDVGFFFAADFRYGFALGPVVVAPGLRPAGYFPPDQTILTGLATLRLTFPVGPVGPFITGGAGPGWVKHPSTVGVAYSGGGGFMVHIGTRFGFGAEASYQGITNTNFRALFVGPLIMLSF